MVGPHRFPSRHLFSSSRLPEFWQIESALSFFIKKADEMQCTVPHGPLSQVTRRLASRPTCIEQLQSGRAGTGPAGRFI